MLCKISRDHIAIRLPLLWLCGLTFGHGQLGYCGICGEDHGLLRQTVKKKGARRRMQWTIGRSNLKTTHLTLTSFNQSLLPCRYALGAVRGLHTTHRS